MTKNQALKAMRSVLSSLSNEERIEVLGALLSETSPVDTLLGGRPGPTVNPFVPAPMPVQPFVPARPFPEPPLVPAITCYGGAPDPFSPRFGG